tara:strand:- start:1278 stop:2009 length:732 start_codon:yes stop_codon:yes gene_type:complete
MSKSWLELLKKSSDGEIESKDQPEDAGWMRMLRNSSKNKHANTKFHSKPKSPKPSAELYSNFSNLSGNKRVLAWTFAVMLAVGYIAYDLQQPIKTHPYVWGWKDFKLGMPFSEAKSLVYRQCEERIDMARGSGCGSMFGKKYGISIANKNKYLFWNYLGSVTVYFGDIGANGFQEFYDAAVSQFGQPQGICHTDLSQYCFSAFANGRLMLSWDGRFPNMVFGPDGEMSVVSYETRTSVTFKSY